MEYSFLRGKRDGKNELLYVHSEKMLYVLKDIKRGKKIFICYETILKKKSIKKGEHICTSRVTIDLNGKCTKNRIDHTSHENHEEIMRDCNSLNTIKSKCKRLQKEYPVSSHKITVKDIFLDEMAK